MTDGMRRTLPNGMVDTLPPQPQLSMGRKMPKGLDCHYCGKPATTKDHVVAKTRGGSNSWWNLVPACVDCNSGKGSAHPTCACEFCGRAQRLYNQGWKRRVTELSPFLVKAPPVKPLSLSEALMMGTHMKHTPYWDETPPSFDGSV